LYYDLDVGVGGIKIVLGNGNCQVFFEYIKFASKYLKKHYTKVLNVF